MPTDQILLSYIQVNELTKAYLEHKKECFVSLDLNISKAKVFLDKKGITLPDGQQLDWKKLKKIAKHDNRCYLIDNNQILPIVVFSEKTQWVRTLFPTASAPTTLVSGLLMHRIKNTDPLADTKTKVSALMPLKDTRVLDTATGLGYTAIELAKHCQSVVTVELDPAALEIARLNPWSNDLFDFNKITQIVGNIEDEVKIFGDNSFDRILHDPPTFKIADTLYTTSLYKEFCRILARGGLLFHYIGDPDSKHGASITGGVIKRLQEAGFTRITKVPEAFGLLATK